MIIVRLVDYTLVEGDRDNEVAACSGFPCLQGPAKQMYSGHIEVKLKGMLNDRVFA